MRKLNNYQYIKVWTDNEIGNIELQRPKVLNAINQSMVAEILTALCEFDYSEQVKVIVLFGAGKSFAAGADIKEMMGENAVSMELKNQFADWDRIALIKKPVIAAVHGFVLGGGFELALCADMIFAAANSKFGFPEVKLGVMPSAGGCVKLTKLIGKRKALEFLWSGNHLEAEEAKHWGMVNRIVPNELLMQETIHFAEKLKKQPALALRLIKDTVRRAENVTEYEAMQYERKNFSLLFASEDQQEGMQAFMEKRSPHFQGK